MKILACLKDRRYTIRNQLYFFGKFLAEKTDVVFFGHGHSDYKETDVLKIAKKVKPDIVLVEDNSQPKTTYWTNVEKLDTTKVLFQIEDVHRLREKRIKIINKRKFDLLTSPLITELEPWKPHLNTPIHFIPHSANTDFYKPRFDEREFDVIFRGATGQRIYPLRKRIVGFLESSKHVKHGWKKRPPGDYKLMNAQEEWLEYATALANSKIFMFGVGIYRKALVKFWQGGACKTMIMADKPYDMKENHLIPDENFVVINENNFKEKMEYYLEDEDARLKIVENMYQTTMKHHNTEKIVEEFIKVLEGI